MWTDVYDVLDIKGSRLKRYHSVISVYKTANCQFPQAELGEMDTWQEDTNAWEDESDAAWEAEEVLR